MKTKQTVAMVLMVSVIWAAAAISGHPEDPLDLGSAGDFVILAKSGISTVPDSDIEGDMGVSPIDSTAITGFALVMDGSGKFSTSAQVTGNIYASDYMVPTPSTMTTAISDMETAFTQASLRTLPDTTELMAGDISGLTITPGLHKWSTDVLINEDVTLDAQGDASAVFIFQISGDLLLANGKSVILAAGAQAKNIFWQIEGPVGAVVGTYAHMEGVVLTEKAITIETGASFNGKLLAQTAVTLDQNKIVDSNLIPPPQVELEIVSEHGEGTPPVGDYINDYGTILTNHVTGIETLGGTQYVNIGWTMTGNEPVLGSETNMVMTHTNDAVLTWQWSTNYLLDASAGMGGDVTGDTNGFYLAGTNVAVTAEPDIGHHFVGWTGDVSGPTNDATQNLTMDQARTLEARFAIDQLTLEIVSEHGIADLSPGIYTNDYGTILTNHVTAIETIGGTQYVNIGWTMTGNEPVWGSETNMVMTHTNDAVLTWQWSTNYLLDASAGMGGDVTGDTNGFYAAESSVTVTAVATPGYHFTGWTGDVIGQSTNATQTMTMDQARVLTAHFAHDPVTLEIVSDYGVGTPPVGLYTNAYGTTLTNHITGTETIGGTQYFNIGWTMTGNEPALGGGTNMVMVHTNNAVLTWQWNTNIQYVLNASADPGGSITGDPNGFYDDGANVTVTAEPAPGYYFTGWTGDVSDPTNDATQNLVMDQSRTLTARFAHDPVTLEIVSEHGEGTPPVGVYTNDYGTILTNHVTGIETIGGTQYFNIGWSMTGNEPVWGSATNMVMAHTNDAVLTWQWGINYLLDASAGMGGDVTGDTNGYYAAGAGVTVTAVAAPGYHFTGWTGDVSGPTNDATQNLTMDQARTLTAHFLRDLRDAVTLEIVSEHGVGLPPVGVYTNAYGTTLTNRVTGFETIGGTQYVNTGWTMTGNEPIDGLTTNMVMVHTNDAVLTWQWDTNYMLNTSYEPPDGGGITLLVDGYYDDGTLATVTATASTGFVFVGWTGNVSASPDNATQYLTMNQARTLKAHFVLVPLCGTPVTQGAVMELDMSGMFTGTGLTYTATSTMPGFMNAAITADDLLRLDALAPGVTVIAVTATDANANAQVHAFAVQVVGHPNVCDTFSAHEPWNPRFEQRIEVLNDTAIACPAIGLRLLFSDLQPGITIENQTGTAPAPDGRPMIELEALFPDGDTRELSVMYLSTSDFRPDQYPPPTVEIQYILPNAPLAPDPVGPPHIESVQMLSNGRVVLEFASNAGMNYAIDYMNDFPAGAWVTVPLTLQAGGNRVQWIDYGPPATFPAPAATSTRVYRVRQVAP